MGRLALLVLLFLLAAVEPHSPPEVTDNDVDNLVPVLQHLLTPRPRPVIQVRQQVRVHIADECCSTTTTDTCCSQFACCTLNLPCCLGSGASTADVDRGRNEPRMEVEEITI